MIRAVEAPESNDGTYHRVLWTLFSSSSLLLLAAMKKGAAKKGGGGGGGGGAGKAEKEKDLKPCTQVKVRHILCEKVARKPCTHVVCFYWHMFTRKRI